MAGSGAARETYQVTIGETGETFVCRAGESLLKGMVRLGQSGIPVGCVNGGCGVCKVRVLAGSTRRLGPISRAHVTLDEEKDGYTLACRVTPQSDLSLEVVGKFRKPFSKGHVKRLEAQQAARRTVDAGQPRANAGMVAE